MAMAKSVVFLLIFFLVMETIKVRLSANGSNLSCIENERQALLNFKQGLIDRSNRLSSWVGQDCCRWEGVECNNRNGHVVKLDLRNPFPFNEDHVDPDNPNDFAYEKACLRGHEVNPSLFELRHLTYLDLSWNNFSGNKIPSYFGSFERLRYMNLSSAWFGGLVPHHLGNLSKLGWLDLSTQSVLAENFEDIPQMVVDTLHWTSNLFHLQLLDMSGLDLTSISSDFFPVITSLPSLLELWLSNCGLGDIPLLDPPSNLTSLVILDLSDNSFYGPIPNAIRNMSSLKVLDLSYNKFNSNGLILDVLKNLNSLNLLKLSSNEFESKAIENSAKVSSPSIYDSLEALYLSNNLLNGLLPSWLYRLKNLKSLDLSFNLFRGSIPTSFGSFTSMTELALRGNELSGTIPVSLGRLSSVEVLALGLNNLSGAIPSSISSLSQLRELDLRKNNFSGQIPVSFGKLSSLTLLDLSYNQLSGQIPMSFERLSSLTMLDLSQNQLNGQIPMYLGRTFKNLITLDLSSNQLNGVIPESVGQLSQLALIDLSQNSLIGVLSEVHFAEHFKLESLILSGNSLSLRVRSDWLPPFKLKEIELGSCHVGPQFPKWLRTQTRFNRLNMSNAGISDSIPNWFENLSHQISYIDLSDNMIYGKVPNLVKSSSFSLQIFLGSNRLEGPLPRFPSNLAILDLSNNTISGTLPGDIGDMTPALSFLGISNNHINGSIPSSLCRLQSLTYLDLANNHLSGHLPRCWSDLQILEVIDLTSNSLSGSIPGSVCQLPLLRSLHLSNNNFRGGFSLGLQNCTRLSILDIGGNKLSGAIPSWIGESLSSLKVLRVRSNMIYGRIPPKICYLKKLQILDVARNNISWSIPHCFSNFSAMVFNQTDGSKGFPTSSLYTDKLDQVIKGRELQYLKILSLVINMDLSRNNLVGQIPEELAQLSGLIGLNLSENHLIGNIPNKIGQMRSLQSLDLSINHLSGTIPQSISSLTSLSHLNLSHNTLSGPIPSGYQLQTLDDPSIYKGNDELCGPPLEYACRKGEAAQSPTYAANKREEFSVHWFYIGMASGFVVGFWGVCGVIFLKKTWRYAYFRFVDVIKDRLYVVIAIRIVRIKKQLRWNKYEE